ncbi:EAL domain-containing protein [Acidaminobacter sp. JC074]|uniref:bifunctional diguanylate cyclase/phosphodiesterase n=1 Tax=Acidaminobacter sp. JC074 TaxID=2530199 RepID=UPI001F118AC5|nr:EAL domain-containing protein [Acidaminobacter sp. JC074]MCH4889310.1 EAL domain-containing protein [Acidaminobacter sp. JC074]
MKNNFRKVSFIFVVVFFALIVVAVFFNLEMKRSLEDNIVYRLENEIHNAANEVSEYLFSMTELTRQMSFEEDFINIIKSAETVEDVQSFYKYKHVLQRLDDINASASHLNLVWIGIKDANLLVTSNHDIRITSDYVFEERPWYIDMEAKGDLTYTRPYFDYFTEDKIITIAIPLYEENEVIGAFGIDIEVWYLESLLNLGDFENTSNLGLILDKDITYYNEVAQDRIENENFSEEVRFLWNEIITKELGVIDLAEYGIDEFLAFSSLSVSDYRVVGVREKKATENQLTLLNNMTIAVVVAVLIGFAFLIYTIRVKKSNVSLAAVNKRLEENERELYRTNLEMEAAHQQLAASEAQLQAQYDDIKVYTNQLETIKAQFEMAVEFTSTTVWELNYDTSEVNLLLGAYTLRNMDVEIPKDPIGIISLMFDKESVDNLVEALEACKQGLTDTIFSQAKYKDQEKWALVRGKTVDQEGTGKKILRGVILDITEIKKHQAQIETQANTDFLTGLPNRRMFDKVLNERLFMGKSGAVLLMDLDNFKEINDTLGHAYGDEVLKAISKQLKYTDFRDQEVFRFGGDEFLFIIDYETNEEIDHFTNKVLDFFRKPIKVGREEVQVKFSIGVSKFPQDGSSVNILLRNTDLAMYAVKEEGKDNYKMFDKSLLDRIQIRSDIEKTIRQALDNNGFKLVYQPQVESISGEVKGYEALIRLKNNKYYPDQFIEVAETTGLIIDIGRYVIKDVIKYLSKLKVMGIEMPIAVNISPKQLGDKSLGDYLKRLLKEYEVDPKYIDFEITESLLVENVDEVLNFLKYLKSIGIKMSLDDFGTGYSSISYLTFLPIDKLKLDKSIIERFIEQKREEVLKNIIEMAHNFDFEVVAEGVETKDQFKLLRDMSCDFIQGYYFSKPVEQIEKQVIQYKL